MECQPMDKVMSNHIHLQVAVYRVTIGRLVARGRLLFILILIKTEMTMMKMMNLMFATSMI